MTPKSIAGDSHSICIANPTRKTALSGFSLSGA
jgi:hypothetical protein